MKKLNKILAAALLIILISALTSFIGVGGLSFAADSFEKTNVLDDLKNSTIDGTAFSESRYPSYKDGELKVINLVEYGLADREENCFAYALYIYIYNPALIDIKSSSGQNTVELASAYDSVGKPSDYEKYDIQLCSTTSDGLFLKYKVIDHITTNGSTLLSRAIAGKSSRRYDISSVELLTRNSRYVADYPVSKTYTFTGYAKGLATESNTDATLRCTTQIMETVELKLQHTNYLTGYSGYEQLGTEQNIQSIYFAIDNEKIEKYGYLYSLKMIWESYATAPMLVISDEELFKKLSRFSGAVIPANTDINNAAKIKEALESAGYSDLPSTVNLRFYWYLGLSATFENGVYRILAPIIFSTNGADRASYVVTADEIEEYLQKYSKSYHGGKITINGKTYSLDLFLSEAYYVDGHHTEKIITFDKTFDVRANKAIADAALDKFLDSVPDGKDYSGIKPIEELTLEKLNEPAANIDLFINSRDMNNVIEYVESANENNQTVYIIRFDVSSRVTGNFPGVLGIESDPGGYFVCQEVYLGLDVIWITLTDEVTQTLLPVVADPINIISALTPPPYTTASKHSFNWALFIKIAIIVVLVIIAFIVLWPVIGDIIRYLFKGLWWIISAPFRGIKALIEHTKK